MRLIRTGHKYRAYNDIECLERILQPFERVNVGMSTNAGIQFALIRKDCSLITESSKKVDSSEDTP